MAVVREPVGFVVARYLLTDPRATPAAIAKACHVRTTSAARAYRKIRAATDLAEPRLFRHLLDVRERPHWPTVSFQIPNPEQWWSRFTQPKWLSGEAAAAQDGYDLVPERWTAYVLPDDVDAAIQAAKAEYAKVAPAGKANLTIRIADPWLQLDPESDLVDRGQRLLDYWDSKHVQLTAALLHA